MLYIIAAAHVTGLSLMQRAKAHLSERERGSETIEKVLWAVAVIVIVGIVVAAIKAYVTKESGKIN